MLIEQAVTLPVTVDRAWALLSDIPAVSACVPGVEAFEDAGENAYRGILKLKVGPITLRLQGNVTIVEQDKSNYRSTLQMTAADAKISGSVVARSTMTLLPAGSVTSLQIRTDATILGKLGDFGQPVIRRKADQIMREFADNVTRRLAQE
jgi:carbon monoxide dehydrogenase subunit G